MDDAMTKKILIVDDEPHLRSLIEQTLEDLEDEGVVLDTAENGRRALDYIEKERPDLVFLDVMMPEFDGFQVCQRVKKEWQYSQTYIVMLTAKGQEFDKEKGRQVGADVYITKPFDPDEILEKAKEVLKL